MRSIIKVHTLLEKFFGPLPELDIKILVSLGDNWVSELVGIGPIYLPLFWLVYPKRNVLAE